MLNGALADKCRVLLFTTAGFSGTWIVSKPTNEDCSPVDASVLAAATHAEPSYSWPASAPPKTRGFDSAFVSSVIKSMSFTTDSLDSKSLQPEHPSEEQVMTYDAFCRSTQNVLGYTFDDWEMNLFTLGALDDQWDWEWTGSLDILPEDFGDRWNQLEDYVYTGPAVPDDPEERTRGLEDREEISQRHSDISEAIHDSLVSKDVKEVARVFISTCPEDWTVVRGSGLLTMLKQEMQGHDPNDRCYGHIDIIDFVTYRWDLAQLADLFVTRFRLIAPWGQPCLLWTRDSWQTFARQRDKEYYNRYYHAFRLLAEKRFLPDSTERQGPSFVRVIQYLAAAIAWTPNPSDARRDEVVELVEEMREYDDWYHFVCLRVKGIISRRKEWLDKIGR